MRVCAHIVTGPFGREHRRFATVADAQSWFRSEVCEPAGFVGMTDEERSDYYGMDLYPACDLCDSEMNFHDYPMTRYGVGPRGGMIRVSI